MSTVYVAMHELSARMPVAGRHPREVVPSGRRLTGGASAQSSAGRSVRDVKPTRECHYQRITDRPRPRGLEQGGALVVAALGIGIIGTVLVIILVIVAILFFVRRR
jgi:hypothetical protein